MRVWILQTGEPLQIDDNHRRGMRAINLSSFLDYNDHKVVLWSANFDHFTKKHRYSSSRKIHLNKNLKINLIDSIGYKNNQGLKRLFDHAQLAFNLNKALKTEPLPEVAFIGYPPIEAAWILARFLKKRNIPFVVDVKDKWPEVLLRALPKYTRGLGKLLLAPYFFVMYSTFKSATSISSISPEFLSYSLKIAKRQRGKYDEVNYLTSFETRYSKIELDQARKWLDAQAVFADGKTRCTFIGSLTSAFDWECLVSAVCDSEIELAIAGDGPLFQYLSTKTKNYPNIIMLGRVTDVQSVALADRTTMFIAPYKRDLEFSDSLPNKFFDAMKYGKPLLSSVTGSASAFIHKYKFGLIYSDTNSLKKIFLKIKTNPEKFQKLGINGSKAYLDYFSGNIVYTRICSNLEKIAKENVCKNISK